MEIKNLGEIGDLLNCAYNYSHAIKKLSIQLHYAKGDDNDNYLGDYIFELDEDGGFFGSGDREKLKILDTKLSEKKYELASFGARNETLYLDLREI